MPPTTKTIEDMERRIKKAIEDESRVLTRLNKSQLCTARKIYQSILRGTYKMGGDTRIVSGVIEEIDKLIAKQNEE